MTLQTRLKIRILGIVSPLVFIVDQLTKRWINHQIPLGTSISVIPGIFDLVHVRNRGAAFGFLSHLPDDIRLPFFFAFSIVALILVVLYLIRLKEAHRTFIILFAMILGGALGNIWDRIFLGEVIDFLSFHWYNKVVHFELGGITIHFALEWPSFNVADAAITVAVFGLMYLMTRKQGDSHAPVSV